MTETALAELLHADLSELDLVAFMVDGGVHFVEHLCVVALGIDLTGGKHPLAVGRRRRKQDHRLCPEAQPFGTQRLGTDRNGAQPPTQTLSGRIVAGGKACVLGSTPPSPVVMIMTKGERSLKAACALIGCSWRRYRAPATSESAGRRPFPWVTGRRPSAWLVREVLRTAREARVPTPWQLGELLGGRSCAPAFRRWVEDVMALRGLAP